MSSDGHFLHRIAHSIIISASFGVSIVFHGSALLCQTTLLKLWWYLFLSKHFGPKCHWFKCYIICAEQPLQIPNSALLFDKGLGPQVLYSKVGGIVLGRLSKLIIMPLLFLPHGSFSPKYHLFDLVLLSRIIFINTEQDLFINWDFGPRCRSRFKDKKNS